MSGQAIVPINKSALSNITKSTLPSEWLKQQGGWFPEQWEEFVRKIIDEGLARPLQIDIDAVDHMMRDIESKHPGAEHRVRPAVRRTIEEIQTPTKLGTATWAESEDFALRHDFADGKIFLGVSPRTRLPVGYVDDTHVLVMCGTRSGKGKTLIIPNHIFWTGPLVSLDPKGENANVTAARRAEGNDVCGGLNQKVWILDPLGRTKPELAKYRGCFNPLDELDPNDPSCITKATMIADSLVMLLNKREEDYWINDTRGRIRDLILHIVSWPTFKDRRHLGTLRDLIMNGDTDAVDRAVAAGADRDQLNPMEMLFEIMIENPAFNGEVSGSGRALLKMYTKGEGQWIGVHGGMRTHTDWLSDTRVRECVSTSDFKLAELKSRPEGMSIYICSPERDNATTYRWQRLLINLMAYEMQETEELPVCGKEVLFCLDEFEALGKLETFERGISHFAGYGIKLMVVVQFYNQLKKHYQENTEAFMSGCKTQVFFDICDETAERVSKSLGECQLRIPIVSDAISKGKSRTIAAGMSLGDQTGGQQTKSHGGSVGGSEAEQVSQAVGKIKGLGGGTGDNEGTSSGMSNTYKQYPFLRFIPRHYKLFREDERENIQTTKNKGKSQNKHWSKQKSVTNTTGTTQTRQWNNNYMEAVGENWTNNRSGNLTMSLTESVQYTRTLSEVFHKRLLISPNELEKDFCLIDDAEHPYHPGLVLLRIRGEDPVILLRANYYQHEIFDGRRDRHPKYPGTDPLPLIRSLDVVIQRAPVHRDSLWTIDEKGTTLDPQIAIWHKKPGDYVRKGDILFEIKPGPSFTRYLNVLIPYHAQVSGRLEEIYCAAGENFAFDQRLASIEIDIEEFRKERGAYVRDEINAFNAETHPAFLAFEELIREEYREAERIKEEQKASRLKLRSDRNSVKGYKDLAWIGWVEASVPVCLISGLIAGFITLFTWSIPMSVVIFFSVYLGGLIVFHTYIRLFWHLIWDILEHFRLEKFDQEHNLGPGDLEELYADAA